MSSVIHSSAIVDSNACLGDNCEVGPYAIIEEGSVVGSNCSIEAHAIIKKGTVLGRNVRVGHFSVLGGDPQHLAFDHSVQSSVQIGDEVRIGEGVTVHRSIYPNGITKVGDLSFLMGYSHVAHDGNLGREVILANGALLGGHVSVGNFSFIGGGAGIHQFAGRNQACGLNLIGMKRRNISTDETKALKHAYRTVLMKAGNSLSHAKNCLNESIICDSVLAKEFVEFFLLEGRGFVKSRSNL
jgi:UDP-N-acetylglucosamine acyltransferase